MSMKLKNLLLLGVSAGLVGLAQTQTAKADVPWLNITDKSVPRTDVVDISSHNGAISVNEFKIMKSYGVKGVMVKLTEATSYRNPYAASQITNAKAAGLTVGGYHYSWYTSPATARAEGQYFAQFAKELGLATNAPMADDLEEAQISADNANGRVNANVQAFRAGVASMGYTNNLLYTGQYYVNQTGLDANAYGKKKMWMASYPFTPSKDNLWHTDYGMWQFSSNMHFPNVGGTFDANIDYAGMITGSMAPSAKTTVTPTAVKKHFTFDQTSRSDGMYLNAPYRYTGSKSAGRVPKTGVVWVEKQEVSSTGTVWYYANVNGQYVWFDSKAGSILNVSSENTTAMNDLYVFNQTKAVDYLYTSAPYGYAGSVHYGDIKNGVQVKVEKQVTRGGTTWFYGTVNGQKMWFNSRAVTPVVLKTTPIEKYFTTNQSVRKDTMMENNPNGYANAKNIGTVPHNINIWVEKQAVSYTGTVWYYGKVNGKGVWFDAKAGSILKVSDRKLDEMNLGYQFDQTTRKDGMALNAPYGFQDAQHVSAVPHGQVVHVKQKMENYGTTWFYGAVNGQNVWFNAKAVKPAVVNTTPVQKYFTTNQSVRKDVLMENNPNGYLNAKESTQVPDNINIWVEKEAVSFTGTRWYYGKVNGKGYWFDAKAGSILKVTDRTHTPVDADYVFDQTTRKDGMTLNAPYGFQDAQHVSAVPNGQIVHVEKKMENYGTTWFYGTVNGQGVWFDAKAVKPASVAKVAAAKKVAPAKVTVPETKKAVVAPKATAPQVKPEVKSERQTQPLDVDFVFEQNGREDNFYKNAPRGEKESEVLRRITNGEVVHVTAQFVAADGTIWYNTKINNESVWFEVKAGHIQA